MKDQQKVYVVEDDASVRKSMQWMLESNKIQCATFESPFAFLDEVNLEGPSCLILDITLPGMSGIELLQEITKRPDLEMPVIILTGTGDVASAVRCMKMGAIDFLEKPIEPAILLATIRRALDDDSQRRIRTARGANLKSRVERLTEREQEVLRLLCEGKSTKEMAARLNISAKTVSIHRWHMMKKMQVGSATEAVRLAYDAKSA